MEELCIDTRNSFWDKHGTLFGTVMGLCFWFLVIRPIAAAALDYSGGFNILMLIGAALCGGLGSLFARFLVNGARS